MSRKHLPAAVPVSVGCSVAFRTAPRARAVRCAQPLREDALQAQFHVAVLVGVEDPARLLKAVRARPVRVVWDTDRERAPTPDDGLDIPPALDRRPKREPTLKERLLADIPNMGSVQDCTHWSLAMSGFADQLTPGDRDEIAAALRTRQKVLALNGGGTHAR
jgi:hypothetical protein